MMHLYLAQNPRTLYLVTAASEAKQGCPYKALIFRAAETFSQVVVEFLPGDEVSLPNAVRVTNRVVKGCLGLITVENGAHYPYYVVSVDTHIATRHLSSCSHFCYRSWQHLPLRVHSRESCKNP